MMKIGKIFAQFGKEQYALKFYKVKRVLEEGRKSHDQFLFIDSRESTVKKCDKMQVYQNVCYAGRSIASVFSGLVKQC